MVVAVVFLFLLAGSFYAFTAKPVYEASGLVQVEQEKGQLDASIGELQALIGAAPAEASAEVAIIKSRMILGAVADSLRLHVSVVPDYFPLIGEAIARRRSGLPEPAAPLFGLAGYAWGGESVSITSFQVPAADVGTYFTLVAGRDGNFVLLDGEDHQVLAGKVGEREGASGARYGQLEIFVQQIVAREGTRFHVARRSPQEVFAALSQQISVSEQPRDSGVLSIKAEAGDPALAARIVNELQGEYLRQNVERRSAQAEQSLAFLKEQLPKLKAGVDEAQARLNSYQLTKGSVDVSKETDLVLTQSISLETQRLALVQQREGALQRYTSQHPVVVTLSEQIRGIEREQQNLKRQVEALPETQQEVLSLMRDLEVNTQLYTSLLNSSQQLQVTKAGTIGNVRIIDAGLPALDPIKPNRKLIVLLSLFLGLFSGVACVFALRTLLKGVDRPEEIERALGLPTYAAIPYSEGQKRIVRRLRSSGSTQNLILAGLDAEDLAIEALRGFRTSLHFAMMEAPNNIVMLTGPIAALGKSFVSINLGAVIAASGKRVVVIDADMRRGHLHRYVGCAQKPGLSDFIAGESEELPIIRRSQIANLDFVACGTRPPNPSEILMSERFSAFLARLSAQYDFVLVDTPPVLPVTDAAIVGRLAGSTFVVLKSAEHPMRAVEETVKRLRQGGVQVRGTIFNQVGARLGSYGYGTYGYSYGYSTYGYSRGPSA